MNTQPMTAKMGDFMNNSVEKSVAGYKTVTPVYIKKLHDQFKNNRTIADFIGVSDATIGKALRDNQVSMPYEVAAEGIYMRLVGEEAKRYTAIIQHDKNGLEFVKTMMANTGGRFQLLDV